jgi:hypothetical protein
MTFKSGQKKVGFKSKMPARTQRNHPHYKVSNSKAAIRATGRLKGGADGLKCMDFDMRCIFMDVAGKRTGVAIGAHNDSLNKEGWTHYKKGNRIIPIPKSQRNMTIQKWVDTHGRNKAGLQLLRRTNGDYPLTHWDAMDYAKEKGVVLCPELKSIAFAIPAVARRVVFQCRRADYPCWTMRLVWMSHAEEVCQAVINEGGQHAIIFGNKGHLANGPNLIKDWDPKPTRVWGPPAAVKWL